MSSDPEDREGCVHVPDRYSKLFLDSFDTTVGRAAVSAASAARAMITGEIDCLLLSGPVGCGKSHLAAAVCNELGEPHWRRFMAAPEDDDVAERMLRRRCPRWVAVPALLDRLRSEMQGSTRPAAQEVHELAEASGLLVLDDLGSEKASEWSIAALFSLVGTRYDQRSQLVITSNLSPSQLAAAGYERITSRMADNGSLIDMRSAKDYRQALRRPVDLVG